MIICEHNYPPILDKIAMYLTPADIELEFVDNEKMRKINFLQRGIDKTTDVLSFPLEPILHFPIGSIVINLNMSEQMAKTLNHSQDEETALLFTHGLLHILGYDHEKDNGEMRIKEIEVIKHFNLPKSLIVRNEEE